MVHDALVPKDIGILMGQLESHGGLPEEPCSNAAAASRSHRGLLVTCLKHQQLDEKWMWNSLISNSTAAFKADLSHSCLKVKFFYKLLSLTPRATQVGQSKATKASFPKDHLSPEWSGCLAAAAPSGITAHYAGEM